MKDVAINSEITLTKVVEPNDSASIVGSGLVDVFSTPSLIAFCEKAASELLSQYLDDGEVSVGSNVNVDHVAPSKIGAFVKCVVAITNVDRRKVTFEFGVYENDDTIAKGTHTRFVVNKQKFLDKLK